MKLYGISNCDTVKKAINWLKQNGIEYEFHDFKKKGITKEKLTEWSGTIGWQTLLNKKGTTWRLSPEEQQKKITSEAAAIELMLEKPSIIKRPVLETGAGLLIGFNEDTYEAALKPSAL